MNAVQYFNRRSLLISGVGALGFSALDRPALGAAKTSKSDAYTFTEGDVTWTLLPPAFYDIRLTKSDAPIDEAGKHFAQVKTSYSSVPAWQIRNELSQAKQGLGAAGGSASISTPDPQLRNLPLIGGLFGGQARSVKVFTGLFNVVEVADFCSDSSTFGSYIGYAIVGVGFIFHGTSIGASGSLTAGSANKNLKLSLSFGWESSGSGAFGIDPVSTLTGTADDFFAKNNIDRNAINITGDQLSEFSTQIAQTVGDAAIIDSSSGRILTPALNSEKHVIRAITPQVVAFGIRPGQDLNNLQAAYKGKSGTLDPSTRKPRFYKCTALT